MRSILIEELRKAFPALTEQEINDIIQGFFDEGVRRGIFTEHFSLDEPLTHEKAEAFRAILKGDIEQVVGTPDVQPLPRSIAYHTMMETFARSATAEHGRGFIAVFLNSSAPDENMSFISASKLQGSQHKDELTQEQFDGIMGEVGHYDPSSSFLVVFFRSEGVEVVCFRYNQPVKLALSA